MQPQTPSVPAIKLGQGNVPFTLAGQDFELKPSINAMRVLSRKYGGLQGAMEKIVQMDTDAVEDVLTLGLGPSYQSPKQREALMNKVFQAGFTDDSGGICLVCQKFVLSLMRGGKPLPTDGEPGEGDETDIPLEGNVKSSS